MHFVFILTFSLYLQKTPIFEILTYVLMKTLCLVISLLMIAAAFVATRYIRREQENNVGNKFLRLIRKFDSWQMMR